MIEPQLEARLLAWIAGELPEAESAELAQLVATRPELASFKQRMEVVHELVAEVARAEPEPLRLSPERRAQLLKTLGGNFETLPLREKIVVPPPKPKWWNGRHRLIYFAGTGIAAGWIIALVFTAVQPRIYREEAQIEFEKAKTTPMPAPAVADGELRSAAGVAQIKEIRPAAAAPVELLAGEEQKREYAVKAAADQVVYDITRRRALAEKGQRDGANAPQSFFYTLSPAPQGNPGSTADQSAQLIANNKDLVQNTLGISADDRAKNFRGFGSVTLGAAAGVTVEEAASTRPSTPTLSLGGAVPGAPMPGITPSAAKSAILTDASNLIAASETVTLGDAKKLKEQDLPLKRADASVALSVNGTLTAVQPVSTFSLHVSDVSFRLAAAALARGELPEVASIRPEEFYNAFDYGDPAPAVAEKIGAHIEQAAHPFLQQRNLLRIALKVAASGRAAQTPLRLTVLLDTSGSMEREDRVAIVRRAMEVLVSLLGPADRLTLIGFARQPRLLAENVAGDRARSVLDLIAQTPPDGGTNLEEALKLAGEHARRQREPGAQNRIVVLTDGAANLGNANPEQLATMVESLRQAGIAFDACGVGLDGLDDAVLEALTRKGDGRYAVLNSPEAADAGFARQLAGAFHPAAENVKVQVRFNPARVASYRLIGFDQHRLRPEDFRNDKVDAAELAADEAGVALYEFEPLPQGEGELGEVFVRFRDAATGQMVERSWTMPYNARAATFDRAAPSLQLASVAALLAEKLRGGPPAGSIKLRELVAIVSALEPRYRDNARALELFTMFQNLRRIVGE